VNGPELLAQRSRVVWQPVATADVARARHDLGVAAGGLIERVSRYCDSISRDFTKLFLRTRPSPRRADRPRQTAATAIAGVDSLRPLASEALLALFKLHMTTQLENAFGKVIERQAKRK
jgi:uncharacterized phage protein gp47/JayE